ncbi:MAG: YbhB YbcL family protein [Burkholderiales bacterium]|jgi:Raf kinase inhibitor-like YbhB/YbcL family protein|nr:YbhB YbcL family protein [Burkholderiales bacterium]
MKIQSKNINNGYLDDQFGKYGTQVIKDTQVINRSFEVSWSEIPANTKSLALIFVDHDAIPVCGFSWVHWTVANIDPKLQHLPENASVELDLTEGITSFNAPLAPEVWKLDTEQATGYGGCAPPDKDHGYTLELYALDSILDIKRGFYTNELLNAMDGHILDQAKLRVWYRV